MNDLEGHDEGPVPKGDSPHTWVTRKSSSVLFSGSKCMDDQNLDGCLLDKPAKSTPQSVKWLHRCLAFYVPVYQPASNEDTLNCTFGAPDLEKQQENVRIDLVRRTNEEVSQRIRNLRKDTLDKSRTDQCPYPIFEAQAVKRSHGECRIVLPPRLVRDFHQFGINFGGLMSRYDILERAVKEVKVAPPFLSVDLGFISHVNSISTSRHTLANTVSHHSDRISPLRIKKSACIPDK